MKFGEKARESVSDISWEKTIYSPLHQKEPLTKVCMPKRKKLVVLSTFRGSPLNSGASQRVFYICRELAKHADVTLVCLGSPKARANPKQLAPGLIEICIPCSRELEILDNEIKHRLGATKARNIAAIQAYHYSPRFMEELARECREADMAVLAFPYLYFALRRVFSGPFVYDAHNVEYDMKNALLPASEYKHMYLEQVRQVEAAACSGARTVFSVSESEASRLVKLYGLDEGKILQVPNGVDLAKAEQQRLSAKKRLTLKNRLGLATRKVCLFLGSYHDPNIQAARAIQEMAPDCPDIVFLLAGSMGKALEHESLPQNVHLLVSLDEAEKYVLLNVADVALNPVITGAGSNLKLLEYIAFGLPVLSTPFGLRGYNLVPGQEVLQAELQDFPKALHRLCEMDKQKLQDMAAKALERCRQEYDWSRAAAPAVRLLQELGSCSAQQLVSDAL